MIPGNFKNRKPANKKPRYLHYDDVFMSKDGSNSEQARRPHHQQPVRNDRSRYSRNEGPQNKYLDNDYIEDFQEEYEPRYDYEAEEFQTPTPREASYRERPLEKDYFSRNQNIIDERMVKYKKRQLPPLQRYGANNPRDIYAESQSSSYWSEQDTYRPRKSRSESALGAIWQKFIITFTSILSLVCLSWVAYNWNNSNDANNTISMSNGHILIEPEQAQFKVLPENPGGIDVPHQDKEVYDRVNPNIMHSQTEEKLLPPEEAPIELSPQEEQFSINNSPSVPAANNSGVEEYSIVDDKVYYIKISAGKSKPVLESEAKLLKKKFSSSISDKNCSVKKVSNTTGEQKHAILVGPFDSQELAAQTARSFGGQCFIISVKE